MRYYIKNNGRIADTLLIRVYDKIVLNSWEFFNPNNDTDLNNLFTRIQKVKRGSICILGLYTKNHNPIYGDFWEVILNYSESLEEFKQSIRESIEYKEL